MNISQTIKTATKPDDLRRHIQIRNKWTLILNLGNNGEWCNICRTRTRPGETRNIYAHSYISMMVLYVISQMSLWIFFFGGGTKSMWYNSTGRWNNLCLYPNENLKDICPKKIFAGKQTSRAEALREGIHNVWTKVILYVYCKILILSVARRVQEGIKIK